MAFDMYDECQEGKVVMQKYSTTILVSIFSFCEIAESKNEIHAFDTTEARGCG